jgi:hypothetical protein
MLDSTKCCIEVADLAESTKVPGTRLLNLI